MAKRGYKLQEFVAHAGNVNCLTFGKKNCRVFITGGDDQKVNLWSVGKPTSLTSLCGHTSPVESAAFDSAEVLVVAGSSSGAIKLWDLEETKLVRTLTGHRSYCTAVEFHPFGEFFASGSMDTNLKIWDIRKKGCIHTYKGHTRGISTIRFSPDGRWVVSGGFDNVVKVWDLTAGKLLHDFKFHEGHIRTIEFHPLEFLLATGSADKTVKFWDLETFEMIGSARREAAGVRSMTFHPDGRSLFCGLDDSLKVYSWEPVICHDSVDMGWSTLGDLCIHDGKLLGGAYYENSVAVWIADVSLMEPYGTRSAPEQHSHSELKHESQGNPLEKEESHVKPKPSLMSTVLDSESKDIKTIYVDRVNSISSKTADPVDVPKVVQPSHSGQISNSGVQKRSPRASSPPSDSKEICSNRIQKHDTPETLTPSDSSQISTIGIQKQSLRASSPPSDSKEISGNRIQKHGPPGTFAPPDSTKEISSVRAQKHGPPETLTPSDSSQISTIGIQKRSLRASSPPFDSKEISGNRSQKHGPPGNLAPPDSSKEISSVRAQKHGPPETLPASEFKETSTTGTQKRGPAASVPARSNVPSINRSIIIPNIVPRDGPGRDSAGSRRESIASAKVSGGMSSRPPHTRRLSTSRIDMEKMSVSLESMPSDNVKKPSRKDVSIRNRLFPDANAKDSSEGKQSNTNSVVEKPDRTSLPATTSDRSHDSSGGANPVKVVNGVAVVNGRTRSLVERFERKEKVETDDICIPDRAPGVVSEPAETPSAQNNDQKIDVRVQPTLDDNDVLEDLMQSHDVLLSAFRSRLTKLQVVRHFWERNDIKGAINAVKKLPDHSVQVDVVGVLIERMEVMTLDLFSCLLPVLLGLLESKAERHASVSLEMLLKLVAVFGTTVRTTVSAPRSVGVDLHAEERLECCRQCFTHLQNVQNIIPGLVKRGGVLARYAQQLNMILQQT